MNLNLKRLREERALSCRDLANSSGVHEITIYRAEHGKSAPRPRTIRKLAEGSWYLANRDYDPQWQILGIRAEVQTYERPDCDFLVHRSDGT